MEVELLKCWGGRLMEWMMRIFRNGMKVEKGVNDKKSGL